MILGGSAVVTYVYGKAAQQTIVWPGLKPVTKLDISRDSLPPHVHINCISTAKLFIKLSLIYLACFAGVAAITLAPPNTHGMDNSCEKSVP